MRKFLHSYRRYLARPWVFAMALVPILVGLARIMGLLPLADEIALLWITTSGMGAGISLANSLDAALDFKVVRKDPLLCPLAREAVRREFFRLITTGSFLAAGILASTLLSEDRREWVIWLLIVGNTFITVNGIMDRTERVVLRTQ